MTNNQKDEEQDENNNTTKQEQRNEMKIMKNYTKQNKNYSISRCVQYLVSRELFRKERKQEQEQANEKQNEMKLKNDNEKKP